MSHTHTHTHVLWSERETDSDRIAACIVYFVPYLPPVLNPPSYDRARVLEASGRPMLRLVVIGRQIHECEKEPEGPEDNTGNGKGEGK